MAGLEKARLRLGGGSTSVGAELPRLSSGNGGNGFPLRVPMLNTDFAGADPARPPTRVRWERAQLAVLQEVLDRHRGAGDEAQVQAAFPGWAPARHDELLTLSRRPLRPSRVVTFPHSPNAERGPRTSLAVAGQPVTVVSTHLLPTLAILPSTGDRRRGRTVSQRGTCRLAVRRDFVGVVAAIPRETPGPLILAGDLNASPRRELHARLRTLGLADSFQTAGLGFGFTHHARFGHSRGASVWARGATATRASSLPNVLSDHRAVLVELRRPAP